MQHFVIEIKELNNVPTVYTFKVNNGEIKLMKFKGEDEFFLDASTVVDYWQYVAASASLIESDNVSAVIVADTVKNSSVAEQIKNIITGGKDTEYADKEEWQYSILDKFFGKYSKLANAPLKAINDGDKKIVLKSDDKQIELVFCYTGKISFVKDIADDVVCNREQTDGNVYRKVPAKHVKPAEKTTVAVPSISVYSRQEEKIEIPQTETPKEDNRVDEEHCTAEDMKDYLKEETKNYCDTVDYRP